MKAEFSAMERDDTMSGRSKLIDLGDEFPRLTEKERDALIYVHPYLDGMSYREAAKELCIALSSLKDRLNSTFKKIPWLQDDMRQKRLAEAQKRRNLRNPVRLGNMTGIGNDGSTDTFFGERIVEKF